MNPQTILGIVLIALPFVLVSAAMVRDVGWRAMFCIWGAVFALGACMLTGLAGSRLKVRRGARSPGENATGMGPGLTGPEYRVTGLDA